LMRIKEDSKRVKICIKNNMITSERGVLLKSILFAIF
jgi:hypothetical protein